MSIASQNSRILSPSVLHKTNPLPPCTSSYASCAFPTYPLRSPPRTTRSLSLNVVVTLLIHHRTHLSLHQTSVGRRLIILPNYNLDHHDSVITLHIGHLLYPTLCQKYTHTSSACHVSNPKHTILNTDKSSCMSSPPCVWHVTYVFAFSTDHLIFPTMSLHSEYLL